MAKSVTKPAAKKVARKPAVKETAPGKVAKAKKKSAPVPPTEQAPVVADVVDVVDVVALSATSEAHSVTTREPARNQLAEDVERFLAQGGKIEEVPRSLRADPPRKPENNYGRGSI